MRSRVLGVFVFAAAIAALALPGCGGGSDGVDGKDGLPGTAGKDGVNGTNGKDGAPGANGTNGADGAAGAAGEKGDKGDPGDNAVDTGVVNGTLTSDMAGDIPEGVTVKTTPDVGVTSTSDAAGAFTMTLPVGIYVLNLSSPNYASMDLPSISVTGGASIAVTAKLTAVNPLVLTAPVASKPVGFGAAAQFDITVSGGT
ncbi:MAG: carboxypeptidase regulatory-like domain-containing protein, partial [Deltaproteobacteria bacterium]|nr:carboxypeptidase regulatory-like domain-containing protein [Deltaproteobacteria bacterium]